MSHMENTNPWNRRGGRSRQASSTAWGSNHGHGGEGGGAGGVGGGSARLDGPRNRPRFQLSDASTRAFGSAGGGGGGGGSTFSSGSFSPLASPGAGASSAFALGSGAFASFGSSSSATATAAAKAPGSQDDSGTASAAKRGASVAGPGEGGITGRKEAIKSTGPTPTPPTAKTPAATAARSVSAAPSSATQAPRVSSSSSVSSSAAAAAAAADAAPGSSQDSDTHPLQSSWIIWYRPPTPKFSDYEKSTAPLACASTVETFWAIYAHLKRPSQLPTVSDYHVFKKDIRPVWEDNSNRHGGKWVLRLKKGVADRYWEDMLLALVGNQFGDAGAEVNGVVLSVRNGEDVLSVWLKSDNGGRNVQIRDALKRILSCPTDTNIMWKSHDASIAQRTAIDQARQEKAQNHAHHHGNRHHDNHHNSASNSNSNNNHPRDPHHAPGRRNHHNNSNNNSHPTHQHPPSSSQAQRFASDGADIAADEFPAASRSRIASLW